MGKTTRDQRDVYYRCAKAEGWRARSAYKLMQLDARFGLFEGVKRAVDLCAAPGSWSQVLAKAVQKNVGKDVGKVVAVDINGMAPLDGVTILRGDITSDETAKAVIDALGGEKADIVVCDGAPDVTGIHEMDVFYQSQLLDAALGIAKVLLAPGASFVSKLFRGRDTEDRLAGLRCIFTDVFLVKPPSSRNASRECFIVCLGFHLPSKDPVVIESRRCGSITTLSSDVAYSLKLCPCADDLGINSDATLLKKDISTPPRIYKYIEPVGKPIDTPLQVAQKEGEEME